MRVALSGRRWLLPLGALLTLFGYFGPWIDHDAAILVVTGLDLGEYVKFLVPVQNGRLSLWREGFYAPLVAVSTALSLFAFRRELQYHWLISYLFLIIAGVAALNMLPPAWSPERLITAEFRLQTGVLLFCLAVALISPFLALLPARLSFLIVLGCSLAALYFPVRNFLRVLPTISGLYNHRLLPGWGPYVMVLGLLTLLMGAWVPILRLNDDKAR